jgi:hypothetical protein
MKVTVGYKEAALISKNCRFKAARVSVSIVGNGTLVIQWIGQVIWPV